jgi:hypothetical protein
MSDTTESNDERPCLHCLIGEAIDDFYAEYGSLSGEQETIDVVEVITALAKTVAEMTFGADAGLRQTGGTFAEIRLYTHFGTHDIGRSSVFLATRGLSGERCHGV